jgi:quercetin dioxygenase-like cupin family protein
MMNSELPGDSKMLLPSRLTISVIIYTALVSAAPAAETPDLPQAFDAGWMGEKTCELLYETDEVRVGRCIFPPGIGHEKHFHYPHFGYVLEGGTLSITDEQGSQTVRQTVTGASWSTTTITVHEALNVGETTTSYIIVEPKSES